jgi:prepilin peptidase CpaA
MRQQDEFVFDGAACRVARCKSGAAMITSPLAIVTALVPSACLVLAAVTDFRHRIIPNALVAAVMISGLALRSLDGPIQLTLSALLCVGVIGLLGLLACFFVIGWGDVKLLGAVTLLVPPRHSATLLLAVAIAGGLLACVYLVMRHMVHGQDPSLHRLSRPVRRGLTGVFDREKHRIRESASMPYAVAILAGVVFQTSVQTVRCWPAILSWQ